MDSVTIKDLATIGIVFASILGSYWKMHMKIQKNNDDLCLELQKVTSERPTYTRVEQMIQRDAFPLPDGKVLRSEMEGIKKTLDSIDKKLDTIMTKNGYK